MTKKFLNKLELIEPSEEICKAYFKKANISLFYYSMYDLLLALLSKIGIKSENHNASIFLLKYLFKENYLFKLISNAKKERIEKQYYVTTEKNEIIKRIAFELQKNAEIFNLKIKTFIEKMNNDHIEKFRQNFQNIGK